MIDFSAVKGISIPEGKVKAIHRENDGQLLWKGGYKNWVPLSTEEDGVSIYNGGLGYKEGYRLSSSGAEKTQTGSTATGFIPAKPGDVVRMAGATWGTTEKDGYCYILYYNSNFTKLASVNRFKMADENGVSNIGGNVDKTASSILTDENGVTTFNIIFTAEVDYEYIRISATGNGADMIVTVNEEITL